MQFIRRHGSKQLGNWQCGIGLVVVENFIQHFLDVREKNNKNGEKRKKNIDLSQKSLKYMPRALNKNGETNICYTGCPKIMYIHFNNCKPDVYYYLFTFH